MLTKPIAACGFATAPCGKASPYRSIESEASRGYASRIAEAQPQAKTSGYLAGKPKAYRTVLRQSREQFLLKFSLHMFGHKRAGCSPPLNKIISASGSVLH
jgi:hypothetical protein